MDGDDELLLLEWNDDSLFLENSDDISLSFQSYLDDENVNKVSQACAKKGDTFLQQIDEDLDYAFALSLQTQYEEEVGENILTDSKKSYAKDSQASKPLSIIDEQWELIDPHPDIYALFQEYDAKFFYGKLKHVEVKWSPRMTLCAGVCSYEGRGGLCSVRLSVPLLKLRPRKDLVETLLHEMIHAYLFVTHNNKDRDGHGPQFLSHMHRINKETGTRISVYHSFHDEVELYRQHWWKCDGPCKKRHPFYGVLKRAMNRPPGPKDNWWTEHQANCGGTFIKIKGPDNQDKKKTATKRKAPTESKGPSSDIRGFLKNVVSETVKTESIPSTVKSIPSHSGSSLVNGSNISTINSENSAPKKIFTPFQGTGYKLSDSSGGLNIIPPHRKANAKSKDVESSSSSGKAIVPLPNISKVPRLINSKSKVYDDHKPSTSATSNTIPKNLVQSPIENFLPSRRTVTGGDSVKKNNFTNQLNVLESDTSKVSCPVCCILVKEKDINLHLDSCLSG